MSTLANTPPPRGRHYLDLTTQGPRESVRGTRGQMHKKPSNKWKRVTPLRWERDDGLTILWKEGSVYSKPVHYIDKGRILELWSDVGRHGTEIDWPENPIWDDGTPLTEKEAQRVQLDIDQALDALSATGKLCRPSNVKRT